MLWVVYPNRLCSWVCNSGSANYKPCDLSLPCTSSLLSRSEDDSTLSHGYVGRIKKIVLAFCHLMKHLRQLTSKKEVKRLKRRGSPIDLTSILYVLPTSQFQCLQVVAKAITNTYSTQTFGSILKSKL